MTRYALVAALWGALAAAGCDDGTRSESPPPPRPLTAAAIGHYCGMTLVEHVGPKAQIVLAGRKDPVWFSSARDAFAFLALPEEPKDIRAIYVSDMGRAPSWEEPGLTNWIDARRAFFVVGSRMTGGMGADETVPFSDRAAAEKFAAENGGRVVAFADVPRDYVLGAGADTPGAAEAGAPQQPDGAGAPLAERDNVH